MTGAKKLVVGASGFLGSHVTRQLVHRGDDVRVLIRRTSSTKAIEDLDVEYHYGDIFDDVALRAAMAGCDDVFYCVVQSRVAAEHLVMRYAKERGLPAVAMCISNTYGPGDWQPTPHGKQLALAAAGKMPFYVKGWTGEVVGVEDAAAAMILAAEKGRNGERYIVSERFVSVGELYAAAAASTGVKPPRFGVPLWAMYAMGYLGDVVRILFRRNFQLTSKSVRLMHTWPSLDHGKAERELGWQPKPIHASIRRAAHFYREQLRNSR
jgi:dihydroflavonol-4-reductase